MYMNADRWLKRTARGSAWALLACVVVLLVSGWGITQTGVIHSLSFGLIDRRTADSIHRASNVPLALFFLAHVLINIRFGISARRLGWLVDAVLIVVGIAALTIVVYLEYFRLGG
jgi:cytochrome b subunit of formate dehydrogenase